MKAPRKFFEPLAIGAPAPYRELPMRLERMIHFVPPHNEKLRAKARRARVRGRRHSRQSRRRYSRRGEGRGAGRD